MKYKSTSIFLFLCLSFTCVFFCGSVATAQNIKSNEDILYITNRDIASYDSLLNSYYLKKYAGSVNQHYNRQSSQSYSEFDQIPDSVFEKRLKALPTVIPMTYNADVRAYIRMYVRLMGKRCDVMLSLAEYYFPLFEEVLNRYGMPEELKYLTIVESALNPQATSRAGAAGLWQFMYRTGKNYDLEVNSLVDDRRDPYRSTVAAARYLRDLHAIYHDWTLAIAAYNCGPGNVNKAIARANGNKDFWQIYQLLPAETRGYIPAYIAVNYVMTYYHEHGIRPNKIKLPINSDTIQLRSNAIYCFIEKYANIEVEELRALNPQYRTDMVPVSSGRKALNLPASKMHTFIRMEDSIYKATYDSVNRKPAVVAVSDTERIVHKVRRGETMTKIVQRYGVSTNDIRRWNRRKSTKVKSGERLVIYRVNPNATETAENADTCTPQTKTPTRQAAKPAPRPAKPQVVTHTVKQGENLSKIARKYGTTAQVIKKRNKLKSDAIRVGQKLIVKD